MEIVTAILHHFGIFAPSPVKVWWVALVLLSCALRIALVARLVRLSRRPTYPLPLFGLYLLATTASSLMRGDKWSLPAEIVLALLGAAFVAETLWMVYCLTKQPGWAKIFSWAIGALVAITVLHASPEPYPGYPPSLFYWRLYPTAIFLGAMIGAATLSLTKWRRHPYLAHNLIAIPWFAATIWGLFGRALGFDRWDVRVSSTAVWLACLAAWHLVVVAPPFNGRVELTLKAHKRV